MDDKKEISSWDFYERIENAPMRVIERGKNKYPQGIG